MTDTLTPCGATTAHQPHETCPGLDTQQVRDALALTVHCTDCRAVDGEDCRGDYGIHLDRKKLADLRQLEHGTCALCGEGMVRGSVLGAPVDAWHPDDGTPQACPVMPNPATRWDEYAALLNTGISPGHPGLQHFIPALVEP